MTTATDNRPATTPAPAPAPTPASTAAREIGYRSIADGELASAWTLQDYFCSLNTVMRLPGKVRRKVEKEVRERTGIQLPNIQLPKGMVAAAFLLTLGVFVVRPLVLNASGGQELNLSAAFGVWEAGSGRYAGRMFELGEHSIAFRTSSRSPDYTWHRITEVRTRAASDSTLFTVIYDEQGKRAEFAFWYVASGGNPVIRLKNTPEVKWIKTPYEPIARPRT